LLQAQSGSHLAAEALLIDCRWTTLGRFPEPLADLHGLSPDYPLLACLSHIVRPREASAKPDLSRSKLVICVFEFMPSLLQLPFRSSLGQSRRARRLLRSSAICTFPLFSLAAWRGPLKGATPMPYISVVGSRGKPDGDDHTAHQR